MKAAHQLQLLETLDAHFKTEAPVSSSELAQELNWDHEYVIGILKSLEMINMIVCEAQAEVSYALTEEGEELRVHGSPEVGLVKLLPKAVDEIKKDAVTARAMAHCLKNRWARIDGAALVSALAAAPVDHVQLSLQKIAQGDWEGVDVNSLIKRKLVTKEKRTIFLPQATEGFSTTISRQLVDLDKRMLATGEWKRGEFKPYNFHAAGTAPTFGSVHPLVRTRSMFRQILQQMGFEEMDTRRWVENSFWNFDSLFQPQTHPVRDAHDTFFLKSPSASLPVDVLMERTAQGSKRVALDNVSQAEHILDKSYFLRVKQMHESGDGESLGWQCPWDEFESYKLILRTHTTAVTSRVLRYLALEYHEQVEVRRKENLAAGRDPAAGLEELEIDRKFFSIDRVFRNETLDATHLAEFHQVEGIVASKHSSLAELMGIIKTFFAKIGIHDVKFKPAYNPYTEPSMEIFGFHPTLQKWTEIGNSGIFRPEMLKPMGLPEDLVVLGWGLSLERPTMINYNVKDIRELFGPKAKLNVF